MLYSLIHHITCRIEARQALIYQLVSGLTGENGKYNDAKAVHFYPPFFDIFCSPKNNKTVSALTVRSCITAVPITISERELSSSVPAIVKIPVYVLLTIFGNVPWSSWC